MTPILNPAPTSESATRILNSAVQIISESGEASLRIADVMESAGVQAPMIYRHFGDREGLVQSAQLARGVNVMTSVFGPFSEAIARANDADSVRRCVALLMEGMGHADQFNIRRDRLEVLGAAISRPELLDELRVNRHQVSDLLLASLVRVQESGYIRGDLDVVVFVEWVMSSMIGLASVEHLSDVPDVREMWLRMQLQCVNAMLFGDELESGAASRD